MNQNAKQILATAVLLFFLCCLFGCATGSGAYRFYSGPPLPKNEIAFVYAVAGCHIRDVRDGKEKSIKYLHPFEAEAASTMLDLLPGAYIVGTTYRKRDSYKSTLGDKIQLKLNAQAGHVYIIYPQIDGPNSIIPLQGKQKWQHIWRVVIIDINDYSVEECEKYSNGESCPSKERIAKRINTYLQSERPIMNFHPLSETPYLVPVTEEAKRDIKGFWW